MGAGVRWGVGVECWCVGCSVLASTGVRRFKRLSLKTAPPGMSARCTSQRNLPNLAAYPRCYLPRPLLLGSPLQHFSFFARPEHRERGSESQTFCLRQVTFQACKRLMVNSGSKSNISHPITRISLVSLCYDEQLSMSGKDKLTK